MKKLVLMALCLLVIVSGVFAQGGQESKGDKVYNLKLSTQMADTSALVAGFKDYAEQVKIKSGGRLLIEVYPSAQLGSDEDVIEQAIQGVNVAVVTDPGRMGNYVSDFGILGMAYFSNSYDEILKIVESDTYKKWEKELAEDNNIRVLSFNWTDGIRSFFLNKEALKPADLTGLRIRTPGAPAWAESVRSLGATPIAMPWTETYSAIQTKAVDGCEVQLTSALDSHIYEVTKYLIKTEHFMLLNGLIVGERWYKTLPSDLQKILLDEAKIAGEKSARHVLSLGSEIENTLAAKYGMKIIEVDKTPFIEASNAAYEKLGYTKLRQELYSSVR